MCVVAAWTTARVVAHAPGAQERATSCWQLEVQVPHVRKTAIHLFSRTFNFFLRMSDHLQELSTGDSPGAQPTAGSNGIDEDEEHVMSHAPPVSYEYHIQTVSTYSRAGPVAQYFSARVDSSITSTS